jgi:hypothetical protein
MFPNGDPQAVADDVITAINAILDTSPTSLRQFEDLFILRGSLPGLVESLPKPDGLIKLFSGLLKVGFKTGPVSSIPHAESAPPSNSFLRDLRLAITALPKSHPTALLFFDRHRKMAGYSASEALQRLLMKYLARGQSLTY